MRGGKGWRKRKEVISVGGEGKFDRICMEEHYLLILNLIFCVQSTGMNLILGIDLDHLDDILQSGDSTKLNSESYCLLLGNLHYWVLFAVQITRFDTFQSVTYTKSSLNDAYYC